MRILRRAEIEEALEPVAVIAAVEAGFAALARGEVTIPPVGHLDLPDPPGELHIKYGYRRGDPIFLVKMATGFYENARQGLPSGTGLIVAFSSRTGFAEALLLDEGLLTDHRTAAAGAVAAKYLAPRDVECVGIIGAGVQARLQLDYLRHVTACRRALVWARDPVKARQVRVEGFEIDVAATTVELARRCRLIVTTTPSRAALLACDDVLPGTHITAMGSDSPGKQELDAALVERADVLVVDSLEQCLAFGELAHAIKRWPDIKARCVTLGDVVLDPRRGRTRADQVTIADLTGVAIQDIAIANLATRGKD